MEKKEYEVYGLAVVKSDIDGPLREVILRAHALKSRDPAAAWAKFRRDPDFQTLPARNPPPSASDGGDARRGVGPHHFTAPARSSAR